MVDNFLEDVEEFDLADLSVAILVDRVDELVDLGNGDLPVLVHVLEGIVDQGRNLGDLQCSTFVLVICIENLIHCLPKLLIRI